MAEVSITTQEADRLWAAPDIFAVTDTANAIVAKYLAAGAVAWQAEFNKSLPALIRAKQAEAFRVAVGLMQDYMVDPTVREFPTNIYEVNEFDLDIEAIEKEINQ